MSLCLRMLDLEILLYYFMIICEITFIIHCKYCIIFNRIITNHRRKNYVSCGGEVKRLYESWEISSSKWEIILLTPSEYIKISFYSYDTLNGKIISFLNNYMSLQVILAMKDKWVVDFVKWNIIYTRSISPISDAKY